MQVEIYNALLWSRVSSSNLVIIVCPFLSVRSFVNFTSVFLITHISVTTYQIYFIVGYDVSIALSLI